ncbi:DUF922 domain-containing protein [Mesorhizobium sp. VNQ89]|uniref:DUF922 domain-containing Zn-dependent protease n=1 Tax=Mesorhizobium quangtriensis TaxID=3157709 RepID=UPI0032B872A0
MKNVVPGRSTGGFRLLLAIALSGFGIAGARADWKPIEQVQAYSISGTSGPELYASIGENGPKAGVGRVVAFTNFKLTWQRDYRPQADGSCKLVSARPKLILIYTLPKPANKLAEPVASNWKTFYEGVRRHERVHGDMIIDMVNEIVAYSVGLTVENDPNCKKVRTTLTDRLSQISQAQRQRSRDFDRTEMADGGAVHQLILNLVNGG